MKPNHTISTRCLDPQATRVAPRPSLYHQLACVYARVKIPFSPIDRVYAEITKFRKLGHTVHVQAPRGPRGEFVWVEPKPNPKPGFQV